MGKNNSSKVLNLWLPPFLWAALIFSFSSLQTIKTSEIYWQDFILKKTAHILEYGVFAALLYRALKESNVEKKKAAYYAIFIAVVYGVTDEIHQFFTPGREPKVRDVFFDAAGSALAIFLLMKILPKSSGNLKKLAERFQLI